MGAKTKFIKYLSREAWEGEVNKIRPLMLAEHEGVVKTICTLYGYVPVYMLYVRKQKPVLSFIAFTKEQRIYAPIHFYYSALWISNNLDDLKYIEYGTDFIEELKENYTDISIRLSPGYKDIRLFLWNGFSVINNYTYIKKLDDLSYHPETRRNIKAFEDSSFRFTVESVTKDSMDLNMAIFKSLHYREHKIRQLSQLMESMDKTGCMECFNCYMEDRLVASMQVFLDEAYKIAYLVLLNPASKSKKDNIHSALHHFLFLTLKERGYQFVDLMGGDLKGVSVFKTSFRTELIPHFTLNYHKRKVILNGLKVRLINLLRRLIAKF